jgi:hypothetical protein
VLFACKAHRRHCARMEPADRPYRAVLKAL